MDKKSIVAGIAGVAVVGILSYFGYRILKEINELDIDFVGENLDDDYYYRTLKK
jgi:hypothetical protein